MTSMPGCGWVWDECIRNTRRRFQEVEAARTGLICLDPARFCARTRVLQHITPTARARAHTRTQIPHTRWKEWASHGAHNNARGGLWKGAADKRGPLPLGVRSTSLHRHCFFYNRPDCFAVFSGLALPTLRADRPHSHTAGHEHRKTTVQTKQGTGCRHSE
jgi:hypothetical protein